jgi:hypothetical protein
VSEAVLTEEAQALVDAMPDDLEPLVDVRYASSALAAAELMRRMRRVAS